MHSSSSKESSGDICWVRLRCELIVAIFLLTGVTGATRTQAQSLELRQLTASDAAQGNFFGSAVAVSGDTAVVGARYADCTPGDNCGSAYIYRFNGTSWVEEQKLIAPKPHSAMASGKRSPYLETRPSWARAVAALWATTAAPRTCTSASPRENVRVLGSLFRCFHDVEVESSDHGGSLWQFGIRSTSSA